MSSFSPSAPSRPVGRRWRGANPNLDLASRRLEREADASMTSLESLSYTGVPAATSTPAPAASQPL